MREMMVIACGLIYFGIIAILAYDTIDQFHIWKRRRR